ncbi:MAG: AMP-binding protein [Spirochaetaceae bacterium]
MYKSLIDIPREIQKKYPERVSHRYRSGNVFEDKTYTQFVNDIELLTLGLYEFGIKDQDHVSFFVNNRYEWALTDFALQSLSAISVPRGSDTTAVEAEFIFNHSDSKYIIFETLKQVDENPEIAKKSEKIFVVDRSDFVSNEFENKITFYDSLFEAGKKILSENSTLYSDLIDKVKLENIVSIIYTSGTTGNPKGVVLTQNNFIENVYQTAERLDIDEKVGEVTVTILPSWHVFERTFEYNGLSRGISFVYSSLRNFSEDIVRKKPHLLASVPRLWDSIYTKMNTFMKTQPKLRRGIFYNLVKVNSAYKDMISYIHKSYILYDKEFALKRFFKIILKMFGICFLFPLHLFAEQLFKGVRAKVGGRLRCAVSGGGSLPLAIDRFYTSVGITVLNAYGMTECSPGICSRIVKRNTLGSVGVPFSKTEIKILDDDNNIVKRGDKGTLYLRGPQVMTGYYKNPEATSEILSDDGWLCSGDLAKETVFGDFVLVGRSKDTIVLLGGENIDPLSIEDKIQESEMVDHVMLLGQDKKGLTAFIALNEDALMAFAKDVKIKITDIFSGNQEKESSDEYKILEKKIKDELDKKITKETGFKPFERITQVILVKNTFKIGRELTQTLKIKRKQIEKTYHSIISKFMDDSGK